MMLAIAVEFLMGRYFAAAHDDRDDAEWPPHPARLFSALTATLWEVGDVAPAAASALDWLSEQGAPHIKAGGATQREAPTVFVPVNDAAVLGTQATVYEAFVEARARHREATAAFEAAADERAEKAAARDIQRAEKAVSRAEERARKILDWSPDKKLPARETLLPESRVRQPRTFPSVTPEAPTVWFLWPDAAPPGDVRDALDALAAQVTRLGHSASLVACRVAEDAPEPDYVPDPEGDHLLRVVDPGQRARLEEAFERHQGNEPRVLPARTERYRRGESRAKPSVVRSALAGEWLVFERTDGPRLPLTRCVDVAEALRGALMTHADQPPHPVVSGHEAGGRPLSTPHALYVALPYVGSRYADGTLLGAAVLLPAGVDGEGRRHVLRAVGRWEREAGEDGLRLTFGRAGAIHLARIVTTTHRKTLQPERWSRPSRRWASVTPVALDRNPGNLWSRRAETAERAHEKARETVRKACARVGLPAPAIIELSDAPQVSGSVAARRYPSFPRGEGKLRRVLVHVSLTFSEPVSGPLILGSGRFRGLGLLQPTEDRR